MKNFVSAKLAQRQKHINPDGTIRHKQFHTASRYLSVNPDEISDYRLPYTSQLSRQIYQSVQMESQNIDCHTSQLSIKKIDLSINPTGTLNHRLLHVFPLSSQIYQSAKLEILNFKNKSVNGEQEFAEQDGVVWVYRAMHILLKFISICYTTDTSLIMSHAYCIKTNHSSRIMLPTCCGSELAALFCVILFVCV